MQPSSPDHGRNLEIFRKLMADRGWWIVPIPLREKGPRIKGWREMRIGPEDFDRHFHAPCNAGIILGLPDTSGRYLIDIDLDSPEAVKKKLLTSRVSMKRARSAFSCSTLTFLAGSPARVSRKGTKSAKTVR